MCGLCGFVLRTPGEDPVDAALLDRMTDSLAHRGPSDRGTWTDGEAWLGSRRLAVIDLSPAGRMPMTSEDGRYHLVYNGEVYNFAELREHFRLDEKGHVFASRTDTEVLVHLFEELGTDMFRHLNGMFTIAIWDRAERRLVLARDRYGIKPLFLQAGEDRIRFGSEIKAILADPSVQRRPDLTALFDYLSFNYVPGTRTAFEGIEEIPPAHFMVLGADGSRETERYWDLDFTPHPERTPAVARREALELMKRSVERRLIADVPIGVLLSGGLDSSTLLALMAQRTEGPIHTYSVGFEETSFNELPWARLMAQRFGTAHREVVVTADRVRTLLPRAIEFIDEPYGDGSAIPTYCVCERAAEEVVVVLSGEGGDEAFAGYETHAAYKASQLFSHVPRVLRKRVLEPLVRALPVSHKKLSLEFKLKRFLSGQDLPPWKAHLWWRLVLSHERKRALLTTRAMEAFEPQAADRHFGAAFERVTASDDLSRLLYVDSTVFLPDDLMIKNDRMSMAHSLEARVPFTDPDFTSYMAGVPSSVKLPRLKLKRVMKEAMADLLPKPILRKKKVGLEMPYSAWFRYQLRPVLDEWLAPDRLEATGLFRPDAVARLRDDHQQGRRDEGRALWGLLNYMIWYDRYMDGAGV
mgnify:CR=1 FL=1